MKHKEVIERVLNYHPVIPDYAGCDTYKAGDPEEECRGIVSALVPTAEVIRRTGELGCNLLVVHEPLFYTSADGPEWEADFENSVYEEKKRLLDQYGITVWRNHDHMHAHQPDSIFTGVIKYLGWEPYRVANDGQGIFIYTFEVPEATVREMKEHLEKVFCLNGMRYIGRPEDIIRRIAIVGHLHPNAFGMPEDVYGLQVIRELEASVDAIIPGEIIEWTVLSYIRDAVQMGRNKAMFHVGHFNLEELGMKYAAEWMGELVGDSIPVHYVAGGDMYQY